MTKWEKGIDTCANSESGKKGATSPGPLPVEAERE